MGEKMRIIKFKKWQLLSLSIIITAIFGFIVSCVTLKIKSKSVYSELNSVSYIYNKSYQNYNTYKEHVLSEYKNKKVLALTFDDGPR